MNFIGQLMVNMYIQTNKKYQYVLFETDFIGNKWLMCDTIWNDNR